MTLAGAPPITLPDFLLARFAEDETVARAAIDWQGEGALPWVANGGGVDQADGSGLATYVGDDVAPHIARWDPARVLAECDAKRRIAKDAQPWADEDCRYGRCAHQVGDADGGETHWRGVQGWHVLTALALPYADHPDFGQEWRP